MAKCPMCLGTNRIRVDDYSVMQYRTVDCPVCLRKDEWDMYRFYAKGRSFLLDLWRMQGILK